MAGVHGASIQMTRRASGKEWSVFEASRHSEVPAEQLGQALAEAALDVVAPADFLEYRREDRPRRDLDDGDPDAGRARRFLCEPHIVFFVGLGLLCVACGLVVLVGGWVLAQLFDVSTWQGAILVVGSGAVLAMWSFSLADPTRSTLAHDQLPRRPARSTDLGDDESRADVTVTELSYTVRPPILRARKRAPR